MRYSFYHANAVPENGRVESSGDESDFPEAFTQISLSRTAVPRSETGQLLFRFVRKSGDLQKPEISSAS
jgi:hypothetical protein